MLALIRSLARSKNSIMSKSKTSKKDHQQATAKIIVAVSDAGVAAHEMLKLVCGEIRRRKLLKMTASDGTSFTVYEYTIPTDRLRVALMYLPGTTGVLTCHSPAGRQLLHSNINEDKLGPGAAALLAGRSSAPVLVTVYVNSHPPCDDSFVEQLVARGAADASRYDGVYIATARPAAFTSIVSHPQVAFLEINTTGRPPMSNIEVNKLVLLRAAARTAEEWHAANVELGIINPDGTLTPEYGGPAEPKRGSRKKRRV